MFQWIDNTILKSSVPPENAAQITRQSIVFGARTNGKFTSSDFELIVRAYLPIVAQIAVKFSDLENHMNANLKKSLLDFSTVTLFACTDAQVSSIEQAFAAPYVGRTNTAFLDYIWECWKSFTTSNKLGYYKYPCIAILQCSGCGKSRLLRELAMVQ